MADEKTEQGVVEEKKLPKATPHIQDADLDEAAKIHRATLHQIRHFQELNRKKIEKARWEAKKAAEALKKGRPPEGEADRPKATTADNTSAPSPAADAVGVGGDATGPAATQAGTAAAVAAANTGPTT